MERLCPRCGSRIGGDCKFCPNCGLELPAAVSLNKSGNSGYSQQGSSFNGGGNYRTSEGNNGYNNNFGNQVGTPNYTQNANRSGNSGYSQNESYINGNHRASDGNNTYNNSGNQAGTPNYTQNANRSGNSGYSQGESYINGNYRASDGNNTYNNFGNQAGTPNYQRGANTSGNSDMSLKDWLITVFLTNAIPMVSFIITVVWAFSNDTPVNKKRYCQALMIFQCIFIVLGFSNFGCVSGFSDFLNKFTPFYY